jgi:GAF domain-containing protein
VIEARTPANEADRLAALHNLLLLDTPASASFDRLTQLTAKLMVTPMALISLIDEQRQWFLSRFGLEAEQTERGISFCAHAVADNAPLVVGDAWLDPRFADNPLVSGPLRVRAYLGVPIHAPGGLPIGTLCVIDRQPRSFSSSEVQAIQRLAKFADAIVARHQAAKLQVW